MVTLCGGTGRLGVGVGVSLEGGNELGHLFVALDAAEGSLGVEHAGGGPAQHHLPVAPTGLGPNPVLDRSPPQAASGNMPGRNPCPRDHPFDESAERETVVNVVYHRDPAWGQRRPYCVELEARVARSVQAVMNEEVDLLEPADQLWQPLPARPLHIRPAGTQVLRDGYA